MRSSAIHIECPICRAHFHVSLALFKGAKGIRFRCRKCGNSLDVLHPAGTGPDRAVPNDTSFARDRSGGSGTQPAVSLDGQERSNFTEEESTLPAEETEWFPREDGEEEESREELWKKIHSVLVEGPVLVPKPQPKPRWFSRIVPFLILLLFAGGYAYLFFSKVGQEMLSGIGRSLADTVTLFRS
jgi:predicted Zn finger-like uncharacterized protein